MNEPITQEVATNALVLSTVAELSSAIMRKVAGNDISTSLGGQSLTKEMLGQMAMSAMARKVKAA